MALVTFFETSTPAQRRQAAGARDGGQERRVRHPGLGAVRGVHDPDVDRRGQLASTTRSRPFGGGIAMFNMMLGEVAPGGVGSGLYGILILAVITVFVAGLMVGRTPEYLGKKIRPDRDEVRGAVHPDHPDGRAGRRRARRWRSRCRAQSMLNTGPHGFSEVLYAFTSVANNNGSAFAGLAPTTTWYNVTGGMVMLLGRFLPMMFVLAWPARWPDSSRVPASAGTLPTHRPLFVGMLIGVILIVVGLTYFPALALGPLAEGLH